MILLYSMIETVPKSSEFSGLTDLTALSNFTTLEKIDLFMIIRELFTR